MSEKYDRLALATTAAALGIQIGAVVRDALKAYEKKNRAITDFERVAEGDVKNGWRLVIPRADLFKKYANVTEEAGYDSSQVWTSGHPDEDSDWLPMSGMVVWFSTPTLVKNHLFFHLQWYSLIQPKASITLFQAVCKCTSKDLSVWHLSSRTIMVAFARAGARQHLVFLIDTVTRRRRSFVIKVPRQLPYICLAYVSSNGRKPLLHIVVNQWHQNPDGPIGDRLLTFITAKYDVFGADPVPEPISSESITFPIGQRDVTCFNYGFPIMFMAYDESNLADNSRHLCFRFDHQKQWRMETLTEWLANFQATPRGAAIVNAIKDLSPPSYWFKVPSVKEFSAMFNFPSNNELICLTEGQVMRRWIRVPPLKRLALEALFRAYPHLKMSDVAKAVGFEIAEGMPEDDTEEDAEILYLE